MESETQDTSQLASKAKELKEKLGNEARGLASSAESAARSAAEGGKEKLVQSAEGVAEALQRTSAGLREDDHVEIAAYTETIAQKIEQIAGALKSRDLPSLAQEVRQLAQRQPALFLGGAFTAGIVAARFLKSTGNGRGENERGNDARNLGRGR